METKHINYLSNIQALACMAVVLLHVCIGAAGGFEISAGEKAATMAIRNCLLWSVPAFIMVTGVLLLDPAKTITPKKLFGRYVKRMALTIVVFTAFFRIVDVIINKEPWNFEIVKSIGYKIWTGTSWGHMWYLYMLLALYLLMPFYKMITKSASSRELIYLIGLLFVFEAILPLIAKVTEVDTAFYICVGQIYPAYLFLGYMLEKEMIRIPKPIAWGIVLVTAAIMVTMTIVGITSGQKMLTSVLGSYSFPLTVLQSAALFVLLRAAGTKKEEPNRVLAWIDRYAFGIYLFHLLFVKILFVVIQFNPYTYGVWMLLPVACGIFACSLAVTILFKKVPGIRCIL